MVATTDSLVATVLGSRILRGGRGLQGDLVLFGAREAGCYREVAA